MLIETKNTLTPLDLVTINALVEYLACEKGFKRESAFYLLETEVDVPSVTHIAYSSFDRAIALLVDLIDITIH